MSVSFKPIRPLLQTATSTASRLLSYAGLGVGVLLLLCSIQMYVNIQQLLKGNVIRKGGYDYVSVTKKVTNENMGQQEKILFNQHDIDELKTKPYIDGVAPLVATNYQLELSAGGIIPFQTNLFLESIENDFIDTVPPGFTWQEGQPTVPVIVSSDFLEAFNVFGPSYGFPQVSPETATGIPILITCHGDNGATQVFRGKWVAMSDRINSVLVPLSFLEWSNKTFGGKKADSYTRVYVKTKDANNPALLDFLDSKNYRVNKDKTKFGRVKQVLEGIFTGLGVFGLLVVVLALMLFSFYLQLVVARSKESLQLLLTLGYSPRWLSKNVSKKFIPVYIFIVLVALAVTVLMQWSFHHFIMFDRPELHSYVHWTVGVTALALIFLSIITNSRLVRNLLYKMGN